MSRINLKEIEAYFKGREGLKSEPMVLDPCQTVTCLQTFLKGHIRVLKGNPGNPRFKMYWERLLKVYLIVKQKEERRTI